MSRKPINTEFYQKARTYVIAALKFINSQIEKGKEPPELMFPKTTVEDNRTLETEYVSEPLWDIFIHDLEEDLEGLPEYKSCIKAMQSDKTISNHIDCLVSTNMSGTYTTASYYLNFLVLEQLSQKPQFNSEIFDQAYSDIEIFFYNEKIEFQAFAPLLNFSIDRDELDLGNGFRIRKITTDELAQIVDEAKYTTLMNFREVLSYEYVIEIHFHEKKFFLEKFPDNKVSKFPKYMEKFEKLITALRLFKTGNVGFNFLKYYPVRPNPVFVGLFGTSGKHFAKFGVKYSLKGEEVKAFQSFWKQIKRRNLEKPSVIAIALRRFNFAYEREKGRRRLEDKLVDFMIAFEALIFRGGEMGEFRHKLAVRVARLLKEDYEERQEISKEMKEFYDLRSKVVHGEQVSISQDFISLVERRLRETLRKLLLLLTKTNHDEIISMLDLS